MSLSPNEKYPGATEADPNYKDSKFKDNNPSTTNNGSPLKALDRNEQLALQEAMMNAAGFDYNGVVDTPQNSQMFAAYKAALSNGANLLSNHNFLTSSPDTTGPSATQPPPSATPTSYPPGFQIFSGVFANETTGISNLTYIDGRVSFSGGDFYMASPNTGALENITDFVASVADFDGKPRTRGVSYALVGDEYRVTVGIDALEDAGAVLTPLGSVKFEQGSVATGHEAGEPQEIIKTKPLGSAPYVSLGVRSRDFYRVEDYSHLVSGGIWDDAIHKCVEDYQYNKIASAGAERAKLVFPSFITGIHSIKINDLYDTEIDFNGCMLKAVATSAQTSAFWIENYNDIKLSNLTAIFSFSNTNYTYGVLLNGGPGGTIDPGNGLGKELVFSNSTILRFARGLKIGNELIDTNHGQNALVGVHIKECNQGLIAAGSQTIVSVTGGSLGSGGQDIYGIPNSDKIGCLTLGATITMNSMEALKTQGQGYGYGVSNCLSDVYDNQYGTIVHNGSYIETTSIARIFKTPKLSGDPFTPSSLKSSLLLSNLSGGVSGANNISIVCNDDDYAGRLSLQDSSVYGFGGTRTAPAIDVGNSSTEVDLGRRFFRKPFFKSNLEEVVGGVMCLDNDLIARSEGLNGQTITTAGDVLKFQTVFQLDRFDRFKNMYVPATGILTVPKGGFTQMTLEVGLSSNTFDGVVRVLVNGTIKYNFYTSVRMDFSTTLFDLAEGDEVTVKVEPSADVTFGSLSTDYIQVTATR